MKPSLLFALLTFSALSTPAFAADSCQLAIAASMNANDSLRAILGEVQPSDVVLADRENALMIAGGLQDGGALVEAMKDPAVRAYLPGFHLIYVAKQLADGGCEILGVAQGD